MLDEEVIELQTRLAWQEDTLNALSEVIARQDHAIRQLQQQVQALGGKLGGAEGNVPRDPGSERPPHY